MGIVADGKGAIPMLAGSVSLSKKGILTISYGCNSCCRVNNSRDILRLCLAGLNRSSFDNKDVSFEQHCTSEHNMWHYLYFIVLLKVKDPTEFTGPGKLRVWHDQGGYSARACVRHQTHGNSDSSRQCRRTGRTHMPTFVVLTLGLITHTYMYLRDLSMTRSGFATPANVHWKRPCVVETPVPSRRIVWTFFSADGAPAKTGFGVGFVSEAKGNYAD